MATIGEVITNVDRINPNTIDNRTKIRWLTALDRQVKSEVIDTHYINPRENDYIEEDLMDVDFDSYDVGTVLLIDDIYTQVYEDYLKMKIALEMGESGRFSMFQTQYNNDYITYQAWYNRTHEPRSVVIDYRR